MNDKTVILAGGGHAHVHLLKQWRKKRRSKVKTILISPQRHQYYSGMISGFIEGIYDLEEIRIDLERLCEWAGVQFIPDAVLKIEPGSKQIVTASGTSFPYDSLSLNVGSYTGTMDIPGAKEHAFLLKPDYQMSELKRICLEDSKLVIVGGGLSGAELGFGMLASRKERNIKAPITVISAGKFLGKYGYRVQQKAAEIAMDKGLHIVEGASVVRVLPKQAVLSTGETEAFDRLVWLTGPTAPPFIAQSGLRVDSEGYLLVNDNLQSVGDPAIFGAGDCITFASWPELHKAGVYAVREAPILLNNVYRYLSGGHLTAYRPQSEYLSILSTGNREGLLQYRGAAFHGKWYCTLKRFIDTSFIQKYKV